jgi:hypothetical protein
MGDKRAEAMTEAELQEAVIELAQWLGYKTIHIRAAQKQNGSWYVPYEGDTGFPDLFMVHKRTGYMILAELKNEKADPTPAQLEWIGAADERGYIWRPSHWLKGDIEETLQYGAGR